MIEKLFNCAQTDEFAIEKVIWDEFLHYNHVVLPNGQGLPEHLSNSNVYMLVMRGTLSLRLDQQEEQSYPKGSLLKIPNKVVMNVYNTHEEVLEITIVKAPAPGTF
ncbi:MAG: cupin domain-containing protein [Tenericutes bacterium]|nr:cupin domain-containing protein [Mycoplasmatota bacterium]